MESSKLKNIIKSQCENEANDMNVESKTINYNQGIPESFNE